MCDILEMSESSVWNPANEWDRLLKGYEPSPMLSLFSEMWHLEPSFTLSRRVSGPQSQIYDFPILSMTLSSCGIRGYFLDLVNPQFLLMDDSYIYLKGLTKLSSVSVHRKCSVNANYYHYYRVTGAVSYFANEPVSLKVFCYPFL